MSTPQTQSDLAPREVFVTPTIAQHACWLIGDVNLGIQPGMFITRLWRLMESADQSNLDKLRADWPGYVEAFEAQGRKSWGVDWLRAKARNVALAEDESELEL